MGALPRYVSSSTTLHSAHWRRSSHSTGANNCVETAVADETPWAGLLAVRDSKTAAGPALLFTPRAWRRFLTTVTD
ncbi:DUF397 domain-containing protein [Streptomyces tsukubensis]|uniref:DUF397 domain-containing protein n=1 Tax=Streptomyces tsukubensis TaxID=83656 RepID=A0A1V4A6E4_9ACTN|nr:DUF397 domain-containing protein [Streptomyces tsukubensis]OON77328.1 DUF397 domain-containing protein [Streptomyces tsukubensis]QFR92405.1 DUF397 domain-containing protein [Streptomyces tsukubensis]